MNLRELDREVGLPYWQGVIRDIMLEDRLTVAPHVTPRHVEALIRSQCSTLNGVPMDRLRRHVRESVGEANTAQQVLLDLIANSYGI